MKKTFYIVLAIMMFFPMMMKAQNYSQLWKQAEAAADDDLPQTQIDILEKIVKKAEQENNYGQLLKAALKQSKVQASIAPDSLEPAVQRLQEREQRTSNVALKAIYNAVLYSVYLNNTSLDDNALEVAQQFAEKAMSNPQELAKVKAEDYEPLVVKYSSSSYFNHDLLSVIGYETKQYAKLHDYYMTTDNRPAQLFTALQVLKQQAGKQEFLPLDKSPFIQTLDSLIDCYADLQEAGEAAIERYEFMDHHTDATAEQKMQYINKALVRWSGWSRMNRLRNAQRDLTAHQYNVSVGEQVWMPEREQTVNLTGLRALNNLSMKVYSVKGQGDIDLRPRYKDDFKKVKPLLTELPHLTQIRDYAGMKKDYELFEDSLVLPKLPAGLYLLEFESVPATDVVRMFYYVSDVRVLALPMPDGSMRYVSVNATTGRPIANAKLRLTTGYGKNKKVKTLTTDQQGEATYKRDEYQSVELFAYTDDDKFCMPMSGYGIFSYDDRTSVREHAVVYTDRAIYRPGQTVHAAAIFYDTSNFIEHQVKEKRGVTMRLRDANNKIVAEKNVTTDEYGTCTADFTLPSTGLTGRFTVQANNFSQTIRVEEYKRPTFQVEFPSGVEQNYQDGDTVVVKATARSYAGVPVQGAKVTYKVMRRRAYWWWSYSRYWGVGYIGQGSEDEEVARAETITESDGTFAVSMPMILPKTQHPMFYNFVVTADVTDQAGETHQAQFSLPLGNRKTALSISVDEKILVEEKSVLSFHLRNAAGNDLTAKVRYRIDNGKWLQAETGKAISGFQTSLKSGRHQVTAECEGMMETREFVVFSLNDKRPAIETEDWFYTSDSSFPRDGKPVTVQVGSSADNVHILYLITSGNRLLESGSVDKSNELINRKFSYKDEYGYGIMMTFAWMRDGKAYSHSLTLSKPLPDKTLKMKWQTFRDRLTPGQQEEWTLTITMPDGTPANDAQLMATLYDKSLDQITSHYWGLSPSGWLPQPSTSWLYGRWGGSSGRGYKRLDYLNVNTLSFSRFDHSIFPSRAYRVYDTMIGRSAGGRLYKSAARVETMVMDEEAPVMAMAKAESNDELLLHAAETVVDKQSDEEENGNANADVQVRENLNETAFFYPQLITDNTGFVSLKFTLPESLTTWRFMGIAHTKDMMHGSLEGETVAKKDVMLQPNMPRFVREGDVATITARIFNTSEKTVNGTARLQLIDPETDKVVYDQQQKTTVEANGTGTVSFQYQPDGKQLLLIAKIFVSGTDFSDGEQHYLPILPNRERVTVTVPFTQIEPGTKTIDLQKLVPVEEGKLTIEYTNNPAWLMIQALPTVGHPHDDCAVCQAASYYANSIGRYILKENPQAKTVFEQWKREEGVETSLTSQLAKNQELKDILLNETPWVLDAERETEQRQRLADFFDENLMQMRLSSAVEKMNKLQNSDGSWSWWPGMDGSLYMTVSICEMLTRLNKMTGTQPETKKMLDKAFKFMNKEILEEVNEMKKEERKGYKQSFPSFTALQYLYICAIDGRQQPANVVNAHNYLKKLLKKERKGQTMYEKAMSAIILNSTLYVKSLKEYTVYREDMGRYYDTPRAGYSWRDYRIPTQTMAIEAIKALTPQDQQTITEMQRWLLQEKHTQAWDTPLNSVDAVYAFLHGNSQALAPQPATRLAVDGKELETSKATAGIGYVKTTLSSKDTKEFTAEKTSEGTSWGAVYAQFMQKTSEVADQTESGIIVKREVLTSEGKPLSAPLKVGDKVIVRITITNDRDLDFVQVEDRRAACLEPVSQLSGYRWGYYCAPRDQSTNFYYDILRKGKHVLETTYYIDRDGEYQTGTCHVQCAYAPEFKGLTKSVTLKVNKK